MTLRPKRHRSPLGRFLEDRKAAFYNAWGSVILLIGCTMDASIRGMWLPRAGAIVGGLAAYAYFFDPRTSDEWWDMRKNARERVQDNAKADPATPLKPKAEAERLLKATEQAQVVRELIELAEKQRISFRAAILAHTRQHDLALRVQAYWVLIGTLVWAFGDLPVNLFKCGGLTC